MVISRENKEKLGRILISLGLIKEEALAKALEFQKKNGAEKKPIGEFLVEKGFVSSKDIAKALGIQFNLPIIELENINIEKEGQNISILNESGNQYSATVASDFVQAVGGNVVSEKQGDKTSENSQIITANRSAYTPSYLAKMFGCDIRELVSSELEITQAQNNGSDSDNGITIVLGRDFANKYFK